MIESHKTGDTKMTAEILKDYSLVDFAKSEIKVWAEEINKLTEMLKTPLAGSFFIGNKEGGSNHKGMLANFDCADILKGQIKNYQAGIEENKAYIRNNGG